GMDLAQGPIAHPARPLVGIELLADSPAEPDLVEARTVADLDGKGTRANLGEERAGIAFLDGVEAILAVGDQAREHVEASGRAFGIGETGDGRAKLELLDQRHEIDTASLEHGTFGQVDLVEFELGELVAHGRVRPGEEARADAIGDLAEPEIEARRLHLIRFDLGRAENLAARDQRADALAGQDAGAGKGAARGFRRQIGTRVLGKGLEENVAWAGRLHGTLVLAFSWDSVT